MTKQSTGTPLTFERFVKFHEQVVEPRFAKIENRLEGFYREFCEFRNETNQRFDDLYKKFETLHQEYHVISEQLKRIEANMVTKAEFLKLKEQVNDLQRRVDALEEQVME